MSESELKEGRTFYFFDQYETVEAKIVYGKTLEGTMAFKIWLIGRLIFMAGTFEPMEDKLRELISRYRLEEISSS